MWSPEYNTHWGGIIIWIQRSKNKELIDACKPYENDWLKVIHGDIFEVAKEKKARDDGALFVKF